MKRKTILTIGAIAIMAMGGMLMAASAGYVGEYDPYTSSACTYDQLRSQNMMHASSGASHNTYTGIGNGDGDGECDNLTEVTGVLTQDGVYFYLDGLRLYVGPYWYISIKESAYDYDGDGNTETIIEELQGLTGTTVTITGSLHDGIAGQRLTVFHINDMLYREEGKPIWAGGHHGGN
ncbi:MAG: hypothetical protein J7J34_05900 [Thermoplasmata archaeon]|nr:hypothetical protein [Thermoplasmata archaeon]